MTAEASDSSSLPPEPEKVLNDLLVLINKHGTNPISSSFEPSEVKEYYNAWADFWRYVIGINIIPADTRVKKTHIRWSQYQNNPISEVQHIQWKAEGAFLKGTAIIPGKVWHRPDKRGQYFTVSFRQTYSDKRILHKNWQNYIFRYNGTEILS